MSEEIRKTKPVMLAVAGLAIVLGAMAWSIVSERQDAVDAPAGQPEAVAVRGIAPEFDVVRIGAEGNAVIAGRGMARAEIQLLDQGREFGRVIADEHGEWVFVPDTPFGEGAHVFSLAANNPDGTQTVSAAPVVLAVPPGSGAAVVVKLPAADAGLVLLAGEASGSLSLVAARHANGRLKISGLAAARSRVAVKLDDRVIGNAAADDEGRWQISAQVTLRPGSHALQAESGANKTSGALAIRGEMPGDAAEVEDSPGGWTIRRRGPGGPDTTAVFGRP